MHSLNACDNLWPCFSFLMPFFCELSSRVCPGERVWTGRARWKLYAFVFRMIAFYIHWVGLSNGFQVAFIFQLSKSSHNRRSLYPASCMLNRSTSTITPAHHNLITFFFSFFFRFTKNWICKRNIIIFMWSNVKRFIAAIYTCTYNFVISVLVLSFVSFVVDSSVRQTNRTMVPSYLRLIIL